MYFRGIGSATPVQRFTKTECLQAFQASEWFVRLDARAHLIARTVLQRDNGIEARRLAVDSLAEVFEIEPNTLARRFLTHAPVLAAQAAERALAQAGLNAGDIGAVIVSTCTGYLCRWNRPATVAPMRSSRGRCRRSTVRQATGAASSAPRIRSQF